MAGEVGPIPPQQLLNRDGDCRLSALLGVEHSLCSISCARFIQSNGITITSQMERVAHGRRANP
jgi:hypothetical protein